MAAKYWPGALLSMLFTDCFAKSSKITHRHIFSTYVLPLCWFKSTKGRKGSALFATSSSNVGRIHCLPVWFSFSLHNTYFIFKKSTLFCYSFNIYLRSGLFLKIEHMALNLQLHSGKCLLQNIEIWSHGSRKVGFRNYSVYYWIIKERKIIKYKELKNKLNMVNTAPLLRTN